MLVKNQIVLSTTNGRSTGNLDKRQMIIDLSLET